MNNRMPALAACALACWIAGATVVSAQTLPASTASRPTSAQAVTDADMAKEVRSLIERAVKARGQPAEAAKLIEEAADLLKKIHDPAAFQRAAYTFEAKDVNLDHLLKPKTSVKTEKATVLTGKLKLVESGHRKGYPFVGMVDNGKGFIIPVPHESDELEQQDLQLDGKSVYTVKRPQPWKEYYASPDSRLVVLADWLQANPMEILDVATGKTVTVPTPEGIADHYNVYPFKFQKWADDSKSYFVTVLGTTVSPGKMMAYREIWQIDPATGKPTRVSRAEKPWEKDLKWDEPITSSGPSK